MTFIRVLLTSVLSLLLAGPGFATEAGSRSPSNLLVVAQNDRKCPPGSECAAERRKQNRDQRGGGDTPRQGKARDPQAQDGKARTGGADKGRSAPGKAQGQGRQNDRQQGKGQQDRKQPAGPKRNGKTEKKGGEDTAAPRNERRKADKPGRDQRPPAAPAKNNDRSRDDAQDKRRQQNDSRQERRDRPPQQPVKRPVQQDDANKTRDRQPDQKPAPERRAREPALDQGTARPRAETPDEARPRAETPGKAGEQRRAKQPGKEDAREERRRERVEKREQRRKNAPPQSSREPERDANTVERQLAAQGRSDEAERVRELRRKLRRQREAAQQRRAERQENAQERGEEAEDRTDRRRDQRPDREVVERRGDRVIVRFGGNLFIEPEEADDRLLWRARDVEVEEFGDGFTRTIVYRDNGVRIVTVRDPYGHIVSRTRYLPEGREIVLINQPFREFGPEPIYYQEIVLPPLIVPLPQPEYIVETRVATPLQIETALTAPPVEAVERVYTLDEVRRSERLRDKMRRVDIDTITFEFGSAVIPEDQLQSLDRVGEAIEETLRKDPDEVFLIEGHTDAVGSQEDNLVLSDRRAEAVAVALSEDFDIPPENLVTQGYGEDQLKVQTEAAERQNRRVAVRRITPLLQDVAQQQ